MRKVVGALGIVAVGIAFGATVMREEIADAAERMPSFIVANDASNPVPVKFDPSANTVRVANGPDNAVAVAPALWQGTPFLGSEVVLNSGGFEACEVAFTAEPGTAVLVKTITGSFNVPPNGWGGVRASLTLPDGSETRVEVPMARTGGALQVSGIYDRYAGSLMLDGLPVTEAAMCLRGADSAGSLQFVGFTVQLPA